MKYLLNLILLIPLQLNAKAVDTLDIGLNLQLPQDSELKIEALSRDTYNWSIENKRYELVKANFEVRFIAQSGAEEVHEVLSEDRIQNSPGTFSRALIVMPETAVFITSSQEKNGAKQQEYTVKASTDEEQKNLLISFPTDKIDQLLIQNLQLAQTKLPAGQLNPNILSSEYHCQPQNEQLVCTINYLLEMDLNESLIAMPEKKKEWLPLLSKIFL